MKVRVFNTPEEGSRYVANLINDVLKDKLGDNKNAILGLATGSTPKQLYKALVDDYKEGKASFKNAITFNLDEYYPMEPQNVQSYRHFMNDIFFDHVDIDKNNTWIPSSTISEDKIEEHCENFEAKIQEFGGIDLQILGIGTNGHIGFNEPGSTEDTVTRFIDLDEQTRTDAAPTFGGIENVPKHAISMGIKTILAAEKIILMAWGKGKAEIIKQCIEGEITSERPASYLQNHKDVTIILDREAASLI